MAEQIVNIERLEHMVNLFGDFDQNLRILERELGISVISRDSELKVTGDPEAVYKGVRALNVLISMAAKGEMVSEQQVRYVLLMVEDGREGEMSTIIDDSITITARGRPVKPKTLGQKKYIEAISKNTIAFAIGPAGTGKTYLAVAMATAAFMRRDINRIILTRPAVEAGEKLGFLPGDLQNKVDPYLRPLYDALFDMMGPDSFHKYMEKGMIEVAPLAYMRGRTLDDSFIILDEAQNTTREQMKMFLTRLGANSRAVITGDITQIDLPDGKKSGLIDAVRILKNIDDIAICELNEKDVVRHRLVREIIRAYEKGERRRQERQKQ